MTLLQRGEDFENRTDLDVEPLSLRHRPDDLGERWDALAGPPRGLSSCAGVERLQFRQRVCAATGRSRPMMRRVVASCSSTASSSRVRRRSSSLASVRCAPAQPERGERVLRRVVRSAPMTDDFDGAG